MSYSTFLSLSWSVSRGRDTYGYNIARLDDRNTGERFRCMGGGYDMVGTVFGDWLEKTFQSELTELVRANEQKLVDAGYQVKGYRKLGSSFYGLTVKPSGSVSLDGACGFSSMQAIAEAIGLEVTRSGNKRGQTVGFFVSSK